MARGPQASGPGGSRSTPSVRVALALIVLLLLGSGLASAGSSSTAPRTAPSARTAPMVAHSVSPGEEWTGYLGDASHTSDQPDALDLNVSSAPNLTMLWNYSTGGMIVSQPAVLNDQVFFGSWNGREYSVDANNGTFRWSTYTGVSYCKPTSAHGSGITSSSSLANGDDYFGGGGEYWDAVSQSNGSVLWTIFTGNNATGTGGGYYNWGSSVVVGNYAYFGLSSHCDNPLIRGAVLKVDLGTHAVVGRFYTTTAAQLGATVWSTPAMNTATGDLYFATGNLYAGAGNNSTLDDSIVEINASTMTYVDHYQVPFAQRFPDGDFGASVVLFPSATGVPMVADVNKNGILYALDQNNLGAGPVWTYPVSSHRSYSSPAFSHGTIYIGASATNISHIAWGGSVRALNATTGALEWQHGFEGGVIGPIVVSNGLVIAAAGPKLVVLRATNGALLWKFQAPTRFDGGPSVANGRIYIGGTDGILYTFGFPLNATVTASPTSGAKPLFVDFHVYPWGGGQGYTDLWNFGDGTTGTAGSPVHLYHKVGTFYVKVIVRDQNGAAVTRTLTIVVTDPVGRRRSDPRILDPVRTPT